MAEDADFLFDQGLSRVTREHYQGIWVKYREWCKRWEEAPLPVTEEKAIGYVVALASDGTVRHHMAGLRQAHLRAGLPAPVWRDMAKLGQIRKGMARRRAIQGVVGLQRDPLTWRHLEALHRAWEGTTRDKIMWWAAACLCFFGCLRAGEALAPEKEEFDPGTHLAWEDVGLEQGKCPNGSE